MGFWLVIVSDISLVRLVKQDLPSDETKPEVLKTNDDLKYVSKWFEWLCRLQGGDHSKDISFETLVEESQFEVESVTSGTSGRQ
jgi:hypothetical protein